MCGQFHLLLRYQMYEVALFVGGLPCGSNPIEMQFLMAVRILLPRRPKLAGFVCGLAVFALLLELSGCSTRKTPNFYRDGDLDHFASLAAESIEPCLEDTPSLSAEEQFPPHLLNGAEPSEFWDMTLEDAIGIALSNSTVLRDLQGRVINSPTNTPSIFDPAIQESNGQFGVEAALSAFDTQWSTDLFFNQNDRPLNSPDFNGNNILLQQSLANFSSELTKTTAVGGRLFARNNVQYDSSNLPGAAFPSAYEANMEFGFQQPLLLGAGLDVNRIAGPNATPGFFFGNGVVIARLNTDISVHNFEANVIQFVSDVEDAYWELAFAYRDLDAKRAARDAALETWRRVKALYDVGRRGGEAEAEAQAREQLYFFEVQVKTALSGTQASGGVYANERRLRRLLGIPTNNGRLIRPMDEPAAPPVAFDWDYMVQQAAASRVELRRQKKQIRVREMQLIAAKNFLLPRLDVLGTYRFLGLGDDLLGSSGPTAGSFSNAYRNLFDGDFQEWMMGLQFTVPLGFRRAASNLRNAQLQLAKENSVLRDQEQQVVFELSNAVAALDLARANSEDLFYRLQATQDNVAAVMGAYSVQRVTFDVVVQAQRLRADAESAFYRSMIDYMKAVKDVHVAKGSLLQYDGVFLAEGPWPQAAYRQAECLTKYPRQINYVMRSAGATNVQPLAHESVPTLVEPDEHAPDETTLPQGIPPLPTEVELRGSAPVAPLPPVTSEFAQSPYMPNQGIRR